MTERTPITYHEGLTQVLEMKRVMLRTVWRYCGLGLISAVGLFLMLALLETSLWADIWDVLRNIWR
jgi:hypothetical protein